MTIFSRKYTIFLNLKLKNYKIKLPCELPEENL